MEILKTYSDFIVDRSKEFKLEAKSTRHFDNLISLRKNKVVKIEKPLYKMKRFLKINSKVKEQLTNFKTYLPLIRNNEQHENLIAKNMLTVSNIRENESMHLKTVM